MHTVECSNIVFIVRASVRLADGGNDSTVIGVICIRRTDDQWIYGAPTDDVIHPILITAVSAAPAVTSSTHSTAVT